MPKNYCNGSGSVPAEVRRYPSPILKDSLGKCGICDRVLKVAQDGRLRQHSMPGRNTASQDRTREILWDTAPPAQGANEHFAIGLPVRVRESAKPAGWNETTNPSDFVPKHWCQDDYLQTYQIQSAGNDGTFEVMGWFWNPEDLVVA